MSFFAELRQRNVFKVATAYAVVSWLIIQVMDTIAPSLHLPPWTTTLVTVLLLVGFPIALLLAWAFELTPEGIRPSREVDRTGSNDRDTGRKLDFVIIGVLVVALGYFVADKYLVTPKDAGETIVSPAPASGQSIAVLPFENRSELESDRFFTDGIHDDLLTQISRIPDIKTISRTSVQAYRDTTKNLRQIGEELGVATLLEGGVQRAGDQVRINVQLIDVATDAHLWAQTYTRNMTAESIFAIQTEITLAIADALRSVLSPEVQHQLEEDLPTGNLAALEAYFRGKMQSNEFSGGGFDRAIAEFEQAVADDDEFAVAHAWLAKAYLIQIYYSGRPVEQQVALARPHIDRALAIDPELPDAWNALANMHSYLGNRVDAEQAYQRVIELDPNNALGYQDYGNFQRWTTWDLVDAERLFSRAAELDPRNVGIAKEYAESLLAVNETEGVVALLDGLIREHPEFPGGFYVMGQYQRSHLHRYDQAIPTFRRAYQIDPLNPDIAFQLAEAYGSLGDVDNSVFWSERAAALAPDGGNAEAYRGYAAFVQGDLVAAKAHFTRVPDGASLHFMSLTYWHELELADGQAQAWVDRWLAFWGKFDERAVSFVKAWLSVYPIQALAAAGRVDEARQMADELLPILQQIPRQGVVSMGVRDVEIHYAIDDLDAAIHAFRDYVDTGGAEFRFTRERFLPTLKDDPEFVRLIQIVEHRLAEQRARLAVMEADGQLAPIPPLPGPPTAPGP